MDKTWPGRQPTETKFQLLITVIWQLSAIQALRWESLYFWIFSSQLPLLLRCNSIHWTFLDAIASPSNYPCQSVSGSVIDSFRFGDSYRISELRKLVKLFLEPVILPDAEQDHCASWYSIIGICRWFKMEVLSWTEGATPAWTTGTREGVRCRRNSGTSTKVQGSTNWRRNPALKWKRKVHNSAKLWSPGHLIGSPGRLTGSNGCLRGPMGA